MISVLFMNCGQTGTSFTATTNDSNQLDSTDISHFVFDGLS